MWFLFGRVQDRGTDGRAQISCEEIIDGKRQVKEEENKPKKCREY